MITLMPKFAVSASIAFTIVGKVQQFAPESHRLTLRMTFPGGGQYQCLSLFADNYRKHICDFNIRSGRFHPLDLFDNADGNAVIRWPEEHNYLLAFLSDDYPLERIVDDVLSNIGAPRLKVGNQFAGCMALAIGDVLSRFMFDRQPIDVENGWANEDVWSKWLDSVPEDCMLSKPYQDWAAGNLWRLCFRGRSVLFDDEIVFLTGTDERLDVSTDRSRSGRSRVSARIEAHLRGEE